VSEDATAGYTATYSPECTGTIAPGESRTCTVTNDDLGIAADLSVTKADSVDPVTVGAGLTYTITVHNGGPNAAEALTLSDPLPAGVGFTSVTPSQGTCQESLGTVTCDLGTLANGTNATVAIAVRARTTGTHTNTATVASTTFDPSPDNNEDTASTTVNPVSPPPDGECLTYPTFTGASGLNLLGSAAVVGDILRLTPNDFAAQGQAWFSSRMPVAAGFTTDFGFQFTDQAAGGADGITFAIQNASSTAVAASGGSLGYDGISNSLVVELDTFDNGGGFGDPNGNHVAVHSRGTAANGPGPAGDSLLGAAELTPVLEDGAVHRARIVYDPAGTLTIYVDDLATPALTVSVDLDTLLSLESGAAFVGFTAATGAASENHDILDWSYCPGPPAPPSANLSVAKDDSPDPVTIGEELTYTLTVDNFGPSAAEDVVVTDTLPAGVIFGAASATQGSCAELLGSVRCELGTIASGAAATVTITVTPMTTGTLQNTASVSSTTPDPLGEDNFSLANTEVQAPPMATLTVVKQVTNDNGGSAVPADFTLRVSGNSPSPASFAGQGAPGTAVTLGAGAYSVSEDATAGYTATYSPECTGTIAPGESRTCTVTNDDNAPAPTANLTIQKTVSNATPALGNDFFYTLTVTNLGPGPAGSAVVTDDLASPLRLLATPAGCTSAPISGGRTHVECSLGNLPAAPAAGSSRIVTLQVEARFFCDFVGTSGNDSDTAIGSTSGGDVICGGGGDDTFSGGGGNDSLYGLADPQTRAALPASIANTAQVASTTPDPAPANNSASRSVTVVAGVDDDDTIFGNDGNDLLDGGVGTDTLSGGNGSDTVLGGNEADELFGGLGNDLIDGNAGGDELDGGDGADRLNGGDGNDDLAGGEGNDVLGGDDGNDDMSGGAGADTMAGGDGNDDLLGGAAGDEMSGGAGGDDMSGGDGNDTMSGGVGGDDMSGGDGADTMVGGEGNDELSGGSGNDTMFGGAGSDVLSGGTGNDTMYGDSSESPSGGSGAGNDRMNGNAGNDVMFGQDGADFLEGASGNDTLHGGTGADELHGGGLTGGSPTTIVQRLFCGEGADRYSLGPTGEAYDSCETQVPGD
jgi:uncharacterized repeat protein (TIGR01451 family)